MNRPYIELSLMKQNLCWRTIFDFSLNSISAHTFLFHETSENALCILTAGDILGKGLFLVNVFLRDKLELVTGFNVVLCHKASEPVIYNKLSRGYKLQTTNLSSLGFIICPD